MKSIQATGHADLVHGPDGNWWAVFLGIRPVGYPNRHHLGRETCLAPVAWTEDAWPVIGDNGTLNEKMLAGNLPLQSPTIRAARDDFEETTLAPCWNFLRSPDPRNWSLAEKQGFLTLYGSEATLNETGVPAFVGRRQQHFSFQATAYLTFAPERDGEEAGIAVYMNERFHYELAIVRIAGTRKLIFRRRLGTLWTIENEMPWSAASIVLSVRADKSNYVFGFARNEEDEPVPFGLGECGMLATEVAGGFTGVFIAMYATGNGARSLTPAYFDWMDYQVSEQTDGGE